MRRLLPTCLLAMSALLSFGADLPTRADRIETDSGFTWVTYEPRSGVRELSGYLTVAPREKVGKASSFGGYRVSKVSKATNELTIWVGKGKEATVGRALMQGRQVRYASPDWIVYPCATPNDPDYALQWYAHKVSAAQAWDSGNGTGVIVAITDSGVLKTHADLSGQFVSGYNSVDNLTEAAGGLTTDISSAGHGTRCAGFVGAKGNNGLGIAGLAYGSQIMPVRVSNQTSGSALLSDVTEGIRWAAENGARVISTSYTGVDDPSVDATATYVQGLGAVSVWAADNTGTNWSTFDFDSVVVVGGTNEQDERAVFGSTTSSSYGLGVDIFAPALNLRTTFRSGSYGLVQGTSFAAPQVAAILALVFERYPGISPSQAQRKLYRYSRDMGLIDPLNSNYRPGNDDQWGWGRVNAGATIESRPLFWDFIELSPPAGYTGAAASDVNDYGLIVGSCWVNQTERRGCYWLPGETVATLLPTIPGSFTPAWSEAVSVSNTGKIAVNHESPGQVSEAKVFHPSGTWWTVRTPFTTSVSIDEILNNDTLVGTEYSGSRSWAHYWTLDGNSNFVATYLPNQYNNGSDLGRGVAGTIDGHYFYQVIHAYWGNQFSLARRDPLSNQSYIWLYGNGGLGNDYAQYANFATDNGFVGGSFERYTSQGNVQYRYARLFNFMSSARWQNFDYNSSEFVDGNESEFFVGEAGGGWLVHQDGSNITGDLQSLGAFLSNPTARNTLSNIGRMLAINESDDIIANGRKLTTGQSRPVLLKRNRNFVANYDFGQLGSDPTYHGILPTVMGVELLDSSGSLVHATTGIYNDYFGTLRFNIPPDLNQDFRVRVKVPGFLGRTYPALDQPALAPDATSIPMQEMLMGDIVNDNLIDIADYTILASYFDWDSGLPDWETVGSNGYAPVHADVNGDGIVDIGDYTEIAMNFDQVGD